MLNKIKISILAAALISVVSCELPDNIDPKHAAAVPAENIFTNAQKELADVVSTMNYNVNASRLLAQYASDVTYTSESRYNFSDRSIPDNFWSNFNFTFVFHVIQRANH